MEQIYTDFTTKLLPQIQQGLTITKEYFADLFGRYIHYLIVTDTIMAIIFALVTIACSIVVYKVVKWANKNDEWNSYNPAPFLVTVFAGMAIIGFFIGFVAKVIDVVKDKYVPEIRIVEKIQSFRSNN